MQSTTFVRSIENGLEQKALRHGDPGERARKAAIVASVFLGRTIEPYEAAIVYAAFNATEIAGTNSDGMKKTIAALAIASEFAQPPAPAIMPKVREVKFVGEGAGDELEQGIADMAKRLAPVGATANNK